MIQRRTRKGYGVRADGGTLERLKPLSKEYVRARRSMRLSSFTSPGKSNLTRSSELLGAIGARRVRPGSWVINFLVTRDSGLPNARLAQYVAAQGRPFMHLAREELDALAKSYRRSFDQVVKSRVK